MIVIKHINKREAAIKAMMDIVIEETRQYESDLGALRTSVPLWYPARSNNDDNGMVAQEIEVGLEDVRAANSIVIDYDFDRDGYRIRMTNTRREPGGGEEGAYREVAFIPSRIEVEWTAEDEAAATKDQRTL